MIPVLVYVGEYCEGHRADWGWAVYVQGDDIGRHAVETFDLECDAEKSRLGYERAARLGWLAAESMSERLQRKVAHGCADMPCSVCSG